MAEEPDAEVFGPRKKYFKKWVGIPEYFRRTILNNLASGPCWDREQ